MMRTSSVVAICVFAALTSATLMESANPDFQDFWDSVLEETDAAPADFTSPDETFVETSQDAQAAKKAPKKADSARVLKHIADLRAYAIAAHDKVDDFKDAHGNADAGLVYFIYQLGKVTYQKIQPPPKQNLPDDIPGLAVKLPSAATLHPHKKVMAGNVVLQYATAMKATLNMFSSGIGTYVMEHLNKAVLSGEGSLLTTYPGAKGTMVTVDYKRLGLTTKPAYFKKIAAPLSKYSDVLHQVHKQAGSADAAAATLWLQEGQKASFKSFYDQEADQANKVLAASNANVVSAAKQAIAASMKNAKDMDGVTAAPSAGLKAASATKTPRTPTRGELEKAAANAASEWVASQTGDLAKKEVQHMVSGKKLLKDFHKIKSEMPPASVVSKKPPSTHASIKAKKVVAPVKVEKPKLISQGKPTSMSSPSPYRGQGMGLSSKAVDGNTNQNWGGKSCTHTKDMANPWWKVDLQAKYKVSNVKVWNRSDCCGSRLDPFQVRVGSHKCGGNHSIKQGHSKDVSCGNKEGSSVKITVPKKTPLTICEVKVYGSRA